MHSIDQVSKFLHHSASAKQWADVGIRHHHGICVPLFSLKSKESAGIGEFTDLYKLIDWCADVGMDVLQLLPLNDTGQGTSPYSAISASALNPIHLGLSALPNLQSHQDLQEEIKNLQKLNAKTRVDYLAIRIGKKKIFQRYFQREFANIQKTKEFLNFLSSNHDWIHNYVSFKALKIAYEWHNWEDWPEHLLEPNKEELDLQIFLQYLCFLQMEEVKKYAESRHIYLKGDIPILICRDSADVWGNRNLFDLNFSAGSPPDMYSAEGQNWGFPLYNWKNLEDQNYGWWNQRLHIAKRLYHLYRLDHIVGFYRIFAFQKGEKHGHFHPGDEHKWIPHGEKIMKMMLHTSPMLPIGEDLGTVPPMVRQNLMQLGICGTKVMRWERMWDEDRRFIRFEDYPPISMTTVSTHDSETLQLWWKSHPQEVKEFCQFMHWEYKEALSIERHKEILKASHHTGSLFHINLLTEYLALFPDLVQPNPEEERINTPGTISDKNWTYRMRPTLEELLENEELKETVKGIIGA